MRRGWITAVVVILLLASGALAEICKGSKVPRARLADDEAQAILSSEEQATKCRLHLAIEKG